MLAKSWRIGVETTTRSDPTARSDTTYRSPCIIPVASPARHREGAGKIHLPAVQGWGAAQEPGKSTFRRSKVGEQRRSGRTLPLGGPRLGSSALTAGLWLQVDEDRGSQQFPEFARQVIGRRAGFHPEKTWRQGREEREQLSAPEFPADGNGTFRAHCMD